MTGTTDVHTRIADVGSPITLDAFAVDGTVSLEHSTLGDLQIESAEVDGRYASRVGELSTLTLAGPDVKVQASGRVALDTTSASNLTYHVEATRLEALAQLAGQESVQGSAVLDGTLTGNAASLQTTGTMNGSGLGWKENSALDANSQYTVTVPDLDVREGAGAVDYVGDIREGRRARAERSHGDDHVPEHAARLRCHGKATGSGG